MDAWHVCVCVVSERMLDLYMGVHNINVVYVIRVHIRKDRVWMHL